MKVKISAWDPQYLGMPEGVIEVPDSTEEFLKKMAEYGRFSIILPGESRSYRGSIAETIEPVIELVFENDYD